MKNNLDYAAHAAKLFCIIVYAVLAYFALKYVLPTAFPLLVIFIVSFFISRAAKGISARLKIPQGVCAFFLVSLMLCGVGICIYFVLSQLVSQISMLVKGMSGDALDSLFCSLEKIPFVGGLASGTEEYARDNINPVLTRALSSLSGTIGGFVSAAVGATPRALFSGIVYIMCVYYMSVDFDSVLGFLKRLVPSQFKGKLHGMVKGAVSASVKLLKAYALIFLITLAELFVGLSLLCPSYALAFSLLIAVLDILPVLGAGAVLLPWGVARLALGDTLCGVGLIVLYLVILITHRIAEPRLIGKSVGIHPLAAVLCMYVGYRFFGMAGMLVLPFAVSLVRDCRS